MSDERPIGVFDSGIGGLTVLHALRKRLPHEHFIYLGDTARVPYGTKGADTVRHFSRQAAALLDGRGVKAIVVACNTASALALDALRDEGGDRPVYGVIEPGVEAALAVTRGRVGIIGTLATIGSDRYQALLRAGREGIVLHSAACPLLVPLAEEGWIDGPIATAVAERYLAPLRAEQVDTLILGCTHYPVLKGVLGEVMGEAVQLVDSAEVLASHVASDLDARGLGRAPGQPGQLELLVSDVPQRFAELSQRFLQETQLPRVARVDLEATPDPGRET